MLLNEGLNNHS